jgi:hypothetical protein
MTIILGMMIIWSCEFYLLASPPQATMHFLQGNWGWYREIWNIYKSKIYLNFEIIQTLNLFKFETIWKTNTSGDRASSPGP